MSEIEGAFKDLQESSSEKFAILKDLHTVILKCL